MSLANTGIIATAPPKSTANKSSESAPSTSFVLNTKRKPSFTLSHVGLSPVFAIGGLGFSPKVESLLAKLFICTGWANTIFYVAANFSQNRGLSFGDNRFGVGDLFSWLALAPAYVFGVLSMGAILFVAWKCLASSQQH